MDIRGKIIRVNADSIEIANSASKITVPIKNSVFMLGKCNIPLSLISQNLEVTVSYKDDKVNMFIEPSKKLYIVQIYDIIKGSGQGFEGYAKKLDSKKKAKVKKVKYKTIIYNDSGSALDPNDYPKLIGELILVHKLNKVNILLAGESDFKSKLDSISLLSKISNDYIYKIDDSYVITRGDRSMTLPEFLALNKLGFNIDLNIYNKAPVEVIEFGNKDLIRLAKIKPRMKLYEQESILIDDSKKATLKWKDFDPIKRIQLNHLINVENSNPILPKCFVSPRAFNGILSKVIGLAVYEQIMRFKSDKNFSKYIVDKMKISDTSKYYLDNINPTTINNFQDLYRSLQQITQIIQKVGDGFVSKTLNYENLKFIQDISNSTGFCIHYHDFTEGLTEYKMLPLNCEIDNNPVIKLGRYFDDFFLIYDEDQMKIDGFLGSKQGQKDYKDIEKDNKLVHPFYTRRSVMSSKSIENFIDSITKNLENLIEYCDNKSKGKTLSSQSDFKFDIKLIKELEKDIKDTLGSLSESTTNRFLNLQLTEIAFLVSSKSSKFCCHHCGNNLPDTGNDKVMFNCAHTFSRKHVQDSERFINSPINYCMICSALNSYNIPTT